MIECRLFVDPPAAGPWNMAVDELLLEDAAATGRPALRLYQWAEPTLSLGYFQPLADRRGHTRSAHCPVVRRTTGGGAILHHHELTYSLAVPLAAQGRRPADHYRAVHLALVDALSALGVAAALAGPCTARPTVEPFLCFQRRSCDDVFVGPHKIAGSAQRRGRRSLVQHGSILLAASEHAPELTGLSELTGWPVTAEALADVWLEPLARRLEFALQASADPMSSQRIAELVAGKFAHPDWTGRR